MTERDSRKNADRRFKVVEGEGKRPTKRIGRRRLDAWQCKPCEIETGVASTSGIRYRPGVMLVDGKVAPSDEWWVCPVCLARGVVTRIT
ncbi:MAG: hypothetical protein AAF556_03270 [Pseudomonadota bacterium]